MREHITRYQKNIGNTITKAIFFVALAFLPSACQFYHNTTARYNAYFLADEKMREVETAIFGNMKDDFNDFLKVMPEIDTVSGKAQKTGLDYCIQKASLPIQWHAESKWADYCYLIVAKSRLYQGDFPNGLATLKYVNANGKQANARHQALILLMRYYIYQEEHDNVKYIGEYIVKEYDLLDKGNKRDFHLALAHYYRT